MRAAPPLVLLALLIASGCASGGEQAPPPAAVVGSSTVESGAPCVPRPVLVADPAPSAPVALPPGAVLTDVAQQGGQRLVTGRVQLGVAQVLEHFRSAPGYVVTRDEDEGRSGELLLFGATGDVTVTVARLRCPRGSTGFTLATAVTQPSPTG